MAPVAGLPGPECSECFLCGRGRRDWHIAKATRLPDGWVEVVDFNFKSTFDEMHLEWMLRHSSDRNEFHHYPVVNQSVTGPAPPGQGDFDWPMAGGGDSQKPATRPRLTHKQPAKTTTHEDPDQGCIGDDVWFEVDGGDGPDDDGTSVRVEALLLEALKEEVAASVRWCQSCAADSLLNNERGDAFECWLCPFYWMGQQKSIELMRDRAIRHMKHRHSVEPRVVDTKKGLQHRSVSRQRGAQNDRTVAQEKSYCGDRRIPQTWKFGPTYATFSRLSRNKFFGNLRKSVVF